VEIQARRPSHYNDLIERQRHFRCSESVQVTVAALDFTFNTSGATTQTVAQGGSASYSFTVSPMYGNFPGTVNFSASGLPTGATAVFSPVPIFAGA
jgi:hypothetical protein